MEQDTDLVGRAIDATRAASDLDEALGALVAALRDRFALWFASIGCHPAGAPGVTVLATWSVAETVFEAGAEVSATITPMVTTVLQTLREGSGATITLGSDPESLVERLLMGQGVASALMLPVHCDEQILLVLTLGSSSPSAFSDAGSGFFTALTTGIRPVVRKLATTSQS
jgi:hypothetical protein